jgi:hypothetical protein
MTSRSVDVAGNVVSEWATEPVTLVLLVVGDSWLSAVELRSSELTPEAA